MTTKNKEGQRRTPQDNKWQRKDNEEQRRPNQDTERRVMLVLTGTTGTLLALHCTGHGTHSGRPNLAPPSYFLLHVTRHASPPQHNLQLSATPSVISRKWFYCNIYLLKILNSTITVLCSSCNAFDPRLDIRSNFCEDIWEGVRQIPVASTCQSNNRIPISSRYKV